MFSHISKILAAKQVPTLQRIVELSRSEWPPVTRNYLKKASSPRNAITAQVHVICEVAKDKDIRIGHGMQLWCDRADAEKQDKAEALRDVRQSLPDQAQDLDGRMMVWEQADKLYEKRLKDGVYSKHEPIKHEVVLEYEALPDCRNDGEYEMVEGLMLELA